MAEMEFKEVVRRLVGERPQRDIGERTDLSATTIHDMLRGRIPTRGTLRKFAEGMRLSEEDRAELFTSAGYAPNGRGERAEEGPEARDEALINRAASRAVEEAFRRFGRPPVEDVIARAERLWAERNPSEPHYEPDLSDVEIHAKDGPHSIQPEDVEMVRRYLWARRVLRQFGEEP